MSLRIAYFGTPSFSTRVLDALHEAGQTPTVIVTQPDRPAGRGLILTPSPVKEWALAHEIPVLYPDDLSVITNSEWDLFVVAAYGKIIAQSLLDIPIHGTLNVHPSLLPRFRGPSPIESQILADEKTVGVSIIKLDSQMDHGPILAAARVTPDPWPAKRHDLEEVLWSEGGALLAESIPPFVAGTLVPEEQDHSLATITKKLTKEHGLLDLAADGYQNYLKFCAYQGWPGTYFFEGTKRIKIVDAVFVDGQFMPTRVIPEGKKEQDYLAPEVSK